MADTIRLEVAAAPSVLPLVRMIIGGVGARLDFSLDELADVNLAVEELLCAAQGLGEGPRHGLDMQIGDDTLTVAAGPFRSPELRERLTSAADGFGLSMVFARVVQSVEICGTDDDCYSVVFSKRRGAE
jgi:hypothetical protein